MKITTKFSIGDVVYYAEDNLIVKDVITDIQVTRGEIHSNEYKCSQYTSWFDVSEIHKSISDIPLYDQTQ